MVLLHGFAGTPASWDGVVAALDAQRYRCTAVDLGSAGSFDAAVRQVLDAAPDSFGLCGYSLGGRVALQVALAAPARVTRLVLVATTAGIEDEDERGARAAVDDALAARIAAEPIDVFAAQWMALPLFAGTPPAAVARWREDLLRGDPAAVAASLRALSVGRMTPVWDRLGELTMPAAVIVGARDTKYRVLGERLVAELGRAQPLIVVPDAGHGLPREAPEAVAAAIDGHFRSPGDQT